MKNENRIVELLAESLKRQDQMVDEMQQMRGDIRDMRGDIQEMREGIQEMRGDIQEMKDTINTVAIGISTLTDIVEVWMDKTKEIDAIKDISRIEQHTGLE